MIIAVLLTLVGTRNFTNPHNLLKVCWATFSAFIQGNRLPSLMVYESEQFVRHWFVGWWGDMCKWLILDQEALFVIVGIKNMSIYYVGIFGYVFTYLLHVRWKYEAVHALSQHLSATISIYGLVYKVVA